MSDQESGPGFTGRYVAGLRYMESSRVAQLLLVDPLAGKLAGAKGLELAQRELENLERDQGPGRHLRVPARTRLIDDLLERELGPLVAAAPAGTGVAAQVVAFGAGMCTRAWRLRCLSRVSLLELDLPHMAALKRQLLAEAGAATVSGSDNSSCDAGAGEDQQTAAFPLHAARYACIGADLSAVGADEATPGEAAVAAVAAALAAALKPHGFDPALPTVWVAEALLYYMPLPAAARLLAAAAALSAPGSRLVATVLDRELLEASRSGVDEGHVFKDLWFFDADEMLYGAAAAAFQAAWAVDWPATALMPGRTEASPGAAAGAEAAGAEAGEGAGEGARVEDAARPLPPSTRQLAAARLGADTYVALYGGAELLFVAGLNS
ncbi:hypothetical protein CHLRE_16g655900v5 [Chlamydomonas reinhardtii]|uniref:Uncharacterized protein n=1 Tax=Chlamydomonas reinhardtii TaxID=3055 RepID=A0A2K3CT69_CHLRE|nr:uncharacterized protein CHLRE_16g655900v5 [Chlamydomonas reinhardtii]PNW71476.1 hypothetical protein CHLRE_16g655900v5 [Chlamydomonas reinhardtii]